MATGNESYNRRAALVLGCLQILVALVCICLQPPMYVHDLVVAIGAVGIWAGLFFLITGIVTLLSWHYYHSPMIVAVMTLTIISSIVAAAGLITSTMLLIVGSITSITRWEGDDYYKYKLQEDLGVPMVVMCLVEGILHIVTSVFCCAAICCCRRQEMQVMYVTTSAGPVTLTPAQAQGQDQPPPYTDEKQLMY